MNDDAPTGDQAAALRLMTTCSRALRAVSEPLRRQLRQWELSSTEFGVLEVLLHKGPLPLGELAQRILITGASTTYTVKQLEGRGLMRRRPCVEDHRVVYGELTEAGRALIAEVFPAHAAEMRRLMGGLSTEEKRVAADLMKRLGVAAAALGDAE
ncbi:MarR family transcriptional regulator [Roseisolibacter sp. H3M3-2]|uniref:MarR family winged helix-turn-helix transcriptional regulator n=1 Tax=Roseisolibacter sp. H3M3-2 TaxID=3031323 RepID=UPI0023DB6A98|nr:MarR family transcriptional regulator [Roseisolibacter sp. H3M3-2]MDF1503280.1 MarR family transcriptional regulator [Roseisolibacter sp. H3M3-2]